MKKKFIVISSLLILLLVGGTITGIHIFNNKNTNTTTKDVDNPPVKEEIKKEEIKKNDELQKDVMNEKVDKEVDISKEEIKIPKNEEKQTTSSTTAPKSNVDNNTTYQQPKEETPAPIQKEEVKETPVPSSNNEVKSYVGVPDPNNFNYSMHHGIIEYNPNQRQDCINESIEIGFKDTVDITNTFCLEVYDSNNTILGYYLYIKCNSGNCNNYKN